MLLHVALQLLLTRWTFIVAFIELCLGHHLGDVVLDLLLIREQRSASGFSLAQCSLDVVDSSRIGNSVGRIGLLQFGDVGGKGINLIVVLGGIVFVDLLERIEVLALNDDLFLDKRQVILGVFDGVLEFGIALLECNVHLGKDVDVQQILDHLTPVIGTQLHERNEVARAEHHHLMKALVIELEDVGL